MPDCNEMIELISAHLDGETSSDEEAVLSAHLAGCPDCQRRLDVYGALSVSAEPVPETLVPGVIYKINRNEGSFFRRFSFRGFSLAALAVAALVLVVYLGQPESTLSAADGRSVTGFAETSAEAATTAAIARGADDARTMDETDALHAPAAVGEIEKGAPDSGIDMVALILNDPFAALSDLYLVVAHPLPEDWSYETAETDGIVYSHIPRDQIDAARSQLTDPMEFLDDDDPHLDATVIVLPE